APGRRGHGRRVRVGGVGGVRSGGEPAARPEGAARDAARRLIAPFYNSDVFSPWLAHYDADVRPTLGPYESRTLVDYLSDAARDCPGQAAVLFKGAALTYRQLDRLSNAGAAALRSLGVKRGDRVGLLLPNCPQFLIAEFAAWKVGAILAPLNPLYTEHELE